MRHVSILAALTLTMALLACNGTGVGQDRVPQPPRPPLPPKRVAAPQAVEEPTLEVPLGATIEGDLAPSDQTVHVRGTVNGSIKATRCEVHLHPGAQVTGDVELIGGALHLNPGAEVKGSVKVSKEQAAEKPTPAPAPDAPVEVPTAPEAPQPPEPPPPPPAASVRSGEIVRFGEPVEVKAGEVVSGNVVAFGGPVDIDGKVKGDVASFGGPIDVRGEVGGNVVATGGPLDLFDGCVIDGDAVAMGGPLNQHGNPTVHGQIVSMGGPMDLLGIPRVNWQPTRGGIHLAPGLRQNPVTRLLADFAAWLAATILLLLAAGLVVLLTPRATNAIATKIEEEPLRVAIYGIVGWLLVLPVLFVLVILVVTILLVPVAVILLAVGLLTGSVGVALYTGKRLAHMCNWRVSSLVCLTLIGVIALRFAGLVTMLPWGEAIAGLILALVLTLGLGGALMTRFGTDPTGTWLNKKATASIRAPNGVPPGPGPSYATPAPRPTPNPHDLDDETLEALTQLPPKPAADGPPPDGG